MKKIFSALFICVIIFSNLIISVQAEPHRSEYYPNKITIFGDSISTGYGLEGYNQDNPQHGYSQKNYEVENFGKMLKDKYALTEYYNYASDGLTSGELLDMLRTGKYDDKLKSSDYILVSIGGNDILQFFYGALGKATGLGDDYTLNDIKNINLKDKAVYKNIISYLTSDELSKSKESTKSNFKKNFMETTDYILKQNPKARIIYQTVFNPLSDDDKVGILDKAVESLLADVNKTIRENNIGTQDDRSVQIYYYVDVYNAFTRDSTKYTNISSYDIHPNAEGHKLISELIDEKINEIYYLSIQQADKEAMNNSPNSTSLVDTADTTADKTSEGYIAYITIGSSVVIVAILAYLISKRKNNGRD